MKYLEIFEDFEEINWKGRNKKPRYKYDCERCKFNWCCGFDCSCILRSLPDPPDDSLYVTSKKYNL